jgi:methionine aminopeptidase
MNRQTAYREPAHDPAVVIHGPADFAAMRVAGRLAAETLDFITPYVVPGVTTAEIDRQCEQFQRDRGGIPDRFAFRSIMLFATEFPATGSCWTATSSIST